VSHSGTQQKTRYDYGSRVSLDKIAAILKLYDNGESIRSICAQVHSQPRQVGGIIRTYRDRTNTAISLMSRHAVDAIVAWQQAIPTAATKGDPRPAKDYLQAIGAVQASQAANASAQSHTVAVQVNVGVPGSPVPYDPFGPTKP
jgi:hypothetical protein